MPGNGTRCSDADSRGALPMTERGLRRERCLSSSREICSRRISVTWNAERLRDGPGTGSRSHLEYRKESTHFRRDLPINPFDFYKLHKQFVKIKIASRRLFFFLFEEKWAKERKVIVLRKCIVN